MATPEPDLTPTQLEILRAVWDGDPDGATVAEIWQALARRRAVARTTVLTQVQRLQRRGWLLRRDGDGADRFRAACSREVAEARLARRLLGDFFAGSAAGLVKSLLGDRRIARQELAALKAVVDAAARER